MNSTVILNYLINININLSFINQQLQNGSNGTTGKKEEIELSVIVPTGVSLYTQSIIIEFV